MNFALPFFAFLGEVGGSEMVVIMLVILLLFGGQKLPELARGLGKSIREFKKAAGNVEDEFKRAIEEAPPAAHPLPKLAEPENAPTIAATATPSAEMSPPEAIPPEETRPSD